MKYFLVERVNSMSQQLRTTVVMATYNGEKNILEQLNSIKNQTKKLDEVLIWDDCSTDTTPELIRHFIDENNLTTTWHLKINKQNIGWRKNFFGLLNEASNEIVFTCDQDDIWMSTKIEEMSQAFYDSNVQVLVSDYQELIEPGGLKEEIKRIDTEKKDKSTIEHVIFNENNLFLRRPGCVYAIRKKFIENVNLYASDMENPVHDMAMWGSAVLSNGLYLMRKPLIQWRKHGQSSFKKEIDQSSKDSEYDKRLKTLNRRLQRANAAGNYLANIEEVNDYENKYRTINNLITELQMRNTLLEKEKIAPLVMSFFKYKHKFYYGTDIYHLMKHKWRK